jgi:DNA mismatch repair ATPase MutS
MFHPLLKKPVPASIEAKRGVLVTGSNASGKSTFLKSVALAALLAETIYTVPADSLRMSFFMIYSSMSIRDSISSGDSYYMAEIRAMKRIMDAIKGRRDTSILCFVDEVLRGTNTVERIAASSQLLKSLSTDGVICFAATHDIELTHMLENYVDNYHFSETAGNGTITFSYKLETGRAESRDAIRLLDMICYDQSITKAAFETSNCFMETGAWPKL